MALNPATATLSSVASSATTVSLFAANINARVRTIANDSTAVLYVAFAATATTSAYTVKMAAGDYYEVPSPQYTGVVSGIWASANGSARLTEVA